MLAITWRLISHLLLLLPCLFCCTEAFAVDRPNIILMLVDDMSWVGSSVLMDPNIPNSRSDYHQMPNLEQLAADGMVFSNAYCAGPNCSPTRAALQTGKSPAQMHVTDIRNGGAFDNQHFLRYYNGYPLTPPIPREKFPGETTIAEALKQVDPNYRTGFFGKFDWDPLPKFDGYDESKTNLWGTIIPAERDPDGMFSIMARSQQFIEKAVIDSKPFFLIMAHDAVKSTFALPETVDYFESLTPGVKHTIPAYAAMHYDLDSTLGMIRNTLANKGIAERTYIVFASDNGAATGPSHDEFVNAPLSGGKGTLLEGGIRSPLIVAGPGIAAGTYSHVPVTTVDFFPTFVELAGGGISLPAGVEGASFATVLRNGGGTGSTNSYLSRPFGPNGELFFHFPHYVPPLPVGTAGPSSAVVDGNYKLLRMYGQNGQPNQELLFDLSANLTETFDPASPLNVAAQHREIAASLSAKLDAWLIGVDADLPYDVRTPRFLSWHGSSYVGGLAGWRSDQDVDSHLLESWSPVRFPGSPIGPAPAAIAIDTYQPELPNKGVRFTGNDWLSHSYLLVSDSSNPNIDGDHSATFEFWMRADSIASEQIIFEAGKEYQGLSLSVGDANQDGSPNDLRFAIATSTSIEASIDAPINRFADPTRDFVHVVAVVNDVAASRSMQLFINGHLAASETLAGQPRIDWDGFSDATLGGTDATGVGGSGVENEGPFRSRNFKGEIAQFSFANYALSPESVQQRYSSALSETYTGIATTGFSVAIPVNRPISMLDLPTNSDSIYLIHERQDVIESPTVVDYVVSGGEFLAASQMGSGFSTIQSVEACDSYLIHLFADSDTSGAPLFGTVTFDSPIAAIIFRPSTLEASNPTFGSLGYYEEPEVGFLGVPGNIISISLDRLSMAVYLAAVPEDFVNIRVITGEVNEIEVSGDYNHDGRVNAADYTVWRDQLGKTGMELDADGNRSGRVDVGDYTIWKSRLGETALIEGDYNRDGRVDAADYTVWRDQLGEMGSNLAADENGNGRVDAGDYILWKGQFSQAGGSNSFTNSVPEPSNIVLLMLAIVGWCLSRVRT